MRSDFAEVALLIAHLAKMAGPREALCQGDSSPHSDSVTAWVQDNVPRAPDQTN